MNDVWRCPIGIGAFSTKNWGSQLYIWTWLGHFKLVSQNDPKSSKILHTCALFLSPINWSTLVKLHSLTATDALWSSRSMILLRQTNWTLKCVQFVIWICFLIRFCLSYDFWSPLTVLIFVNARSYLLSLWLCVYGKRPVFHLSPIKRCSIYFDDVWNIIHLFLLGCLFNHTMFKRRETETDSFDLFVWLLSIIRKLWLADTFSRQLWPFYRLWSSSSSAFRFDQFFSWFFWKTIPSTITSAHAHTRNHINSLIDDIQWKND